MLYFSTLRLWSRSRGSSDLSVCGHPGRCWRDAVLHSLDFLRYLSRESSPLGMKKCNHLFALLLSRVFSICLLRNSSRSLHWCLFWCWIVSKVSLKRLDLQKWSVGWILFAALRGDACRQGEEKDDISVLNEGQPFSINTALFFLLNDCFQEYF